MSSRLGIDVGTTAIKICIVCDGVKLSSAKVIHGARSDPREEHRCAHLFDEQDPRVIINALDDCLHQLNDSFKGISKIFVTGQMHGVMLWKSISNAKPIDITVSSIFDASVAYTTNLITWQDQRCNTEFLNQLPRSPPFCKISTGFGIASLAWLQKEYNNLGNYDMCGTIMDFIVWLLTQSDYVTMTSHNANSWGYYDIVNTCWETEKIKELDVNTSLLPKIVPINFPVGNLKYSVYGIETSTSVYPSFGDMQCAVCASQPLRNEAVINIGTSSQLSFITDYRSEILKDLVEKYPSISIVPYNGKDVVVSAASLTGGNVLNSLVTNLILWMEELGCSDIPSKENVFRKLEEAATSHQQHNSVNTQSLCIVPTLFGERFDPSLSGSVSNINTSNCSLGSITHALYKGIIRNIAEMLPVDILKQYGVDAICATGGVLLNNKVLTELVVELYGMTLREGQHADASFGAAVFLDEQ